MSLSKYIKKTVGKLWKRNTFNAPLESKKTRELPSLNFNKLSDNVKRRYTGCTCHMMVKFMNIHTKKLHHRGTESRRKKKKKTWFISCFSGTECLWWTSGWFNWNGCGLTSFLKVNHRTHTRAHAPSTCQFSDCPNTSLWLAYSCFRTWYWNSFKLVWKWMKPFLPWFQEYNTVRWRC